MSQREVEFTQQRVVRAMLLKAMSQLSQQTLGQQMQLQALSQG
jgi:hypothetical protein